MRYFLIFLSLLGLLGAGCGAARSPGEGTADAVADSSDGDVRVSSETAASGGVQATIRYSIPEGEAYWVVHVVADRLGKRVLDERVPPYSAEFAGTNPSAVNGEKAIAVRDLDGDGEPEILLDLYWGGTHCCWWSRIYRWDTKTARYTSLAKLWGNFDYRLADLDDDGQTEFVSVDNRFAYEFTSFAGSSFPLQIWTYRGGRLVDVTRSFPRLIEEDAEQQWRWYRESLVSDTYDARGVLAAWAADECLLDRCNQVLARLHDLKGDLGSAHPDSATEYLAHLRAFLRRTGYLRPAEPIRSD